MRERANWLPLFLHRRFGLGTAGAGTLAGGVLVVGGLVGTLAGGWLADWRSRTRPSGNLEVGMAGFLAGAVCVTLALLAPSLTTFLPMFLMGAIALYLYSGPFSALKQNVVVPTLRASAITLGLLIEHLFGDSFSPLLIGALSDRLHSLRVALLLLLPPMLVLAGVAAATGLRAVGRDTRTMEDQWASRRSEGDRPPRLSPQPT